MQVIGFPDKIGGEGFYIQAFRKTMKTEEKVVSSSKQKHSKFITFSSPWINKATDGIFSVHQENIHCSNTLLAEELAFLQKNLYVRKAGVNVGQVIKNEHIPSHELAMCTPLLSQDIATVNLHHHHALAYLRREPFDLTEDIKKGWQLFQYNTLPLGFAKVLPNRINNYYPQEWKILSSSSK